MTEHDGLYKLDRSGGRIKSAGLPMDFVFETSKPFQNDPSPETAAQAAQSYRRLRENPPTSVRYRFFPLERGEVKALTKSSPALYRPVLKNDQGAGTFGGFTVGADGLPGIINRQTGYVIPEAYFEESAVSKGNPHSVAEALDDVRKHFNILDHEEARVAYERLQIAAQEECVVLQREAQVGREGLMFIRPFEPETPVTISENLVPTIENHVSSAVERLIDATDNAKRTFAANYNLPYRPLEADSMPLYFQADIHVLPGGDVQVAELQIPDVMAFLTTLDPHGNDAFAYVRGVAEKLIQHVGDTLATSLEGRARQLPIYFVTREEVLSQRQDVLEIREIRALQGALEERGISSRVISARQAAELDGENILFLLNLNPQSSEYASLAAAYLKDSKRQLHMIPDPFFRMAEREITDYQQVNISNKQLANLSALVADVKLGDRPKDALMQLMAVDSFFTKLGLSEDVFHICHPSLPTPIPAYRYDIQSLHLAMRMIEEMGLEGVTIRGIPISPDRAMLKDTDEQSYYATFRFLFTQED